MQQLRLLGYTADLAENGKIALQKWRTGNYSLLLTDLHMPEMDGYELAAAIRKDEKLDPRTPIIALTANAMLGEKRRAEIVGIDTYLTKPVQLHLLNSTLLKWLPDFVNSALLNGSLNANHLSREPKIIDVSILKSLVGDEPSTIRDFLSEYLNRIKVQRKQLSILDHNKEIESIDLIAHVLKSSSLSIGAINLGMLSEKLQIACREKSNVNIIDTLSQLNQELNEVEFWLETFLSADEVC